MVVLFAGYILEWYQIPDQPFDY